MAPSRPESAVDQRPRIVRGLVGQRLQCWQQEALAQHRGRLQGGPVVPLQPVEPRLHQAADRARQRRRCDLRGAQRQLLQEQRIAARTRHEAGDLGFVGDARRSLRQAPHGVAAKRSQLDHDQRAPPRSRRNAASSGSPSGRDVVSSTSGLDTVAARRRARRPATHRLPNEDPRRQWLAASFR